MWSYRTWAAVWSDGKKGCAGVLGQSAWAPKAMRVCAPFSLCSLSLPCHPCPLVSLSSSEQPKQTEKLFSLNQMTLKMNSIKYRVPNTWLIFLKANCIIFTVYIKKQLQFACQSSAVQINPLAPFFSDISQQVDCFSHGGCSICHSKHFPSTPWDPEMGFS